MTLPSGGSAPHSPARQSPLSAAREAGLRQRSPRHGVVSPAESADALACEQSPEKRAPAKPANPVAETSRHSSNSLYYFMQALVLAEVLLARFMGEWTANRIEQTEGQAPGLLVSANIALSVLASLFFFLEVFVRNVRRTKSCIEENRIYREHLKSDHNNKIVQDALLLFENQGRAAFKLTPPAPSINMHVVFRALAAFVASMSIMTSVLFEYFDPGFATNLLVSGAFFMLQVAMMQLSIFVTDKQQLATIANKEMLTTFLQLANDKAQALGTEFVNSSKSGSRLLLSSERLESVELSRQKFIKFADVIKSAQKSAEAGHIGAAQAEASVVDQALTRINRFRKASAHFLMYPLPRRFTVTPTRRADLETGEAGRPASPESGASSPSRSSVWDWVRGPSWRMPHWREPEAMAGRRVGSTATIADSDHVAIAMPGSPRA